MLNFRSNHAELRRFPDVNNELRHLEKAENFRIANLKVASF